VKRHRAERQFDPVLDQPVKFGEAVAPAYCVWPGSVGRRFQHVFLAPLQGAGCRVCLSGGVAALDPRLLSANPSGWWRGGGGAQSAKKIRLIANAKTHTPPEARVVNGPVNVRQSRHGAAAFNPIA
jgi:hypothetical protein